MPVSYPPQIRFYVGLDLGQSGDPCALAVLQRTISRGAFDAAAFAPREVVRFEVRFLERWRLGTPYPEVVARVGEVLENLCQRFLTADVELLFDRTGVGRAVGDLLFALPVFRRQRGAGCGAVRLEPVTLTHGQAVTVSPGGEGVGLPKRDLVSAAVVLFQSGLLLIAEALPDRSVLVNELVNFRVKVSAAGSDTYGNDGKNAKHDDYVTAVALPAWAAQRGRRPGGYLMGGGPLPCPGGGAVGSPF
jgi:hypothetical protein